MSTDRENAVSILRACLLSTKGGIQLSILNRDFKSLVGTPIPFKSLGYSSVEDFLRSIKDVTVKNGPNGEVTAHAVPSEESVHIASLVSRQKTSQKKRVAVPSFGRSRKPADQSWNPPTSHYKPPPPPSRGHMLVTVSNDSRNRPSRVVSVKSRGAGASAAAGEKYKRTVPPRFQKLRSDSADVAQDYNNVNKNTDDFDPIRDLPLNFEDNCVIEDYQECGDDFIDNYQSGFSVKSKKSITTPYSPRNAVVAGRAQTQLGGDRSENKMDDVLYNNVRHKPVSKTLSHENGSVVRNTSCPLSSLSQNSKASSNKNKKSGILGLLKDEHYYEKKDDSLNAFGEFIADKLQNISRQQRYLAQRLMTEVLIEAEMSMLTTNSEIVELTQSRHKYSSDREYY